MYSYIEITDLKETINTLIKTTERMDSHISFVEATYETLKKMNPSSMLKAGCHSFDSSTLVSYCDIDRPNRHVLGKNWKSI